MGQYFMPIVVDPAEGTTVRYDIFDCGLKLMEHSYFGNYAVQGISALLKTPKKVFWVGDYADCEEWLEESKFKDRQEDLPLYSEDCQLAPLPAPEAKRRFLVNHTRKEHIDLAEYKRKARSLANPKDAIHPLPILTACGNGQSLSDYWGSNMDKIGLWAGDLIETTDAPPPGSRPLEFVFQFDWKMTAEATSG